MLADAVPQLSADQVVAVLQAFATLGLVSPRLLEASAAACLAADLRALPLEDVLGALAGLAAAARQSPYKLLIQCAGRS